MVGRDLLIGGLAGISMLWLETLATRMEPRAGLPSPPSLTVLAYLEGAAHAIGRGAASVYWILVQSLFSLFLLLILRILFRRRWIAGLAWVLFFSIPAVLAIGRFEGVFAAAAAVTATVALLLVLVRFGLLATCVAHTFHQVPADLNLTFDLSRWYVGQTLMGLALLAALVGYGFTTSLAGRPVFGRDLLEVEAGDKP